MQTMKRSFITLGVVLAGSLALVNCDPGPNTQPGPIDLTVTTEDGSGDDARITTAVHTMLLADMELNEAQREHAGRIVAATSGVNAVNNQLKVKK